MRRQLVVDTCYLQTLCTQSTERHSMYGVLDTTVTQVESFGNYIWRSSMSSLVSKSAIVKAHSIVHSGH